MEITIKKVPASGESTSAKFTVPETGTTVRKALEAAGIKPSKKVKITIGGKPVTDDQYISDGEAIDVITVTEKPKGS